MIEYQRDQQQTIPDSQVKIVGVGGAGLSMIDRLALDGVEGVELLALASDDRSLTSSVVSEKVQLGVKLTMGLGCGGDPELGAKTAKEQELEIRDSLRDRKMVFICAGLGGGTGSGAAPVVARIARELGAFVVVFATMPFEFEGARRREQAETALNELSVIANALVTFENARMGELVLASQGIRDAFVAADKMISESVQAVTRLVVRPGLINVGLADLIRTLSASRSRCLFGSGLAKGENRSHQALENALNSPLLDKGKLLKEVSNVLVHVCGGAAMSLYEVELLMRELSKHVAADAHILFGAAVDERMGEGLSVTLISSLPEQTVEVAPEVPVVEKSEEVENVEDIEEVEKVVASMPAPVSKPVTAQVVVASEGNLMDQLAEMAAEVDAEKVVGQQVEQEERVEVMAQELEPLEEDAEVEVLEEIAEVAELVGEIEKIEEELAEMEMLELDEAAAGVDELKSQFFAVEDSERELITTEDEVLEVVGGEAEKMQEPEKDDEMALFEKLEREVASAEAPPEMDFTAVAGQSAASERGSQAELELDGGPKGKFSGEAPNLLDGEDLDIPPYLRKNK